MYQNIYSSYGDRIMGFCFLCNFLISQMFYIEHVSILIIRKTFLKLNAVCLRTSKNFFNVIEPKLTTN